MIKELKTSLLPVAKQKKHQFMSGELQLSFQKSFISNKNQVLIYLNQIYSLI
jgi:hypothetical protein